jgi:spermidine dehydrogenase
MEADSQDHDGKALGLNSRICRRDFLDGALLASGAALLNLATPSASKTQPAGRADWDGPGGVGDYSRSNGDTWEVLNAAHKVRDGAYDKPAANVIDTGEIFDCIVVGGGLSGLASALFFNRLAGSKRSCLVLENHAIFGGEARRNEFVVNGQRLLAPQGSNLFTPQSGKAPLNPPQPGTAEVPYRYPSGDFLRWFYDQIGLDWSAVTYQKWAGPGRAMPLSYTSYSHARQMPPPADFGFYFGAAFGQRPGLWVRDPWGSRLESSPLPPPMRSEMLRYMDAAPKVRSAPLFRADDRRLDSMTAEDRIIELCGVSRELLRLYLAPHSAAVLGLGPDALSGCLALGVIGGGRTENWHSFPGGNTGMARLLLKTLIDSAIPGPRSVGDVCRNRVDFSALDRESNPVRVRLNSMAVRVEHEGPPEKSNLVQVTYTRNGQAYRARARTVIMAGGGWATRRVVRDLPGELRAAYNQFCYSACLVANVAVRNWRFLHKLGISGGRWFGGFGSWTEVRTVASFGSTSEGIGPDSPTVLTLYVPMFYPGLPTAEQGHKGRLELLSTPYRVYERKIREQFTEMFSASGFNPRQDIAGVILNRWGHAFVNAQPGFYYGGQGQPSPCQTLRGRPFGRISFAHCDLTGDPDHARSVAEAFRAVGQILSAL